MKSKELYSMSAALLFFVLSPTAGIFSQSQFPDRPTQRTEGLAPIPTFNLKPASGAHSFDNSLGSIAPTNNDFSGSVSSKNDQGNPEEFSAEGKTKAPYQLTGRFHLEQGGRSGYLILQCELPSGSYIHSLTMPKEHYPTEIRIAPSPDYQIEGTFQADRPPTIIAQDPVFGHRMEKHGGKTQFFVPILFAEGVDVANYPLDITFHGQVCTDRGSCLPVRNKVITAKFAGYYQRPLHHDSGANQ